MDTARLKDRLADMKAEARIAVYEEGMEPGSWERAWTLGYANGLDAAQQRIEEMEDLPQVTEEQRASFERGRDEITGYPAYSGGPVAPRTIYFDVAWS